MKATATILLLNASCIAALDFDTLLPTRRPTATDPWECTTYNLTTFFKVPMPTGKIEDVVYSHAFALEQGCTPSLRDEVGEPVCTFHAQEKWCAITTAMPEDLLPEYSSYGSRAYSWWAAHSIEAVKTARQCPERWFWAETEVLLGSYWLNETIAMAGCYAAAHALDIIETTSTISSTSVTSRISTTSTTSTARPGTTTSGPDPVSTTAERNLAGRDEGINMWVVGTGAVAALANIVL